MRPFQVIFFWNNYLDLTLGTSNCIRQKIQFGLYLKSGKPSNNFLMVCFFVFSMFKKNRKIKQTRFRESIFNLSVFTTLFWQFFKKQRSSLQECKQFQISHFWEIEKWNLPNKGKKRNKIYKLKFIYSTFMFYPILIWKKIYWFVKFKFVYTGNQSTHHFACRTLIALKIIKANLKSRKELKYKQNLWK